MGLAIRRTIPPLSVLALVAVAAWSAARGDESTSRYFQGLRERKLFSLAEGYCIEQLEQRTMPLPVRTEWTIELSRTYAEHARHASGEEQDGLWTRAGEALTALLQRDPKNPRRLQLQTQLALLRASQGEFLAGQASVVPDDRALADRAAAALVEAVKALRETEKALAAAALKVKSTADAGSLSAYEVRAQADTVRFTLASILLEQARLAPRGSPDRTAAVIDAEELLKRIAGGAPGELLTWNARVMLAECARLRGDGKQVTAIAASVEKDEPPADVLDRLTAVQVRTLLDARKPDDAASLLLRFANKRSPLPGELQFLKETALLALWEIADEKKDTGLAEELWKEVEAQAARAESEAAGWWAYRCRLALETARENRAYGRELGPLVRRAKGAWAGGRLDEAVALYGEAAALAARGGHEDVAVEMAFTRGSIQLQAGKIEPAAEDFKEAAGRYPNLPRAADAHLMWAYCLGRLYETERTTARREEYVAALETHRMRFAERSSFGEATWMLAALQERRLQFTQALPLYEEIPADHKRAADAHVAVARCWESILDRVRELKQPPAEWEAKAAASLEAIVSDYPVSPHPLPRDEAEVCLRYARISLNREQPDYAKADALLERVLRSAEQSAQDPDGRSESASKAWDGLRRTARQLRIVSLAGQKRWPQAEQLVRDLADVSPAVVLAVLDGLSQFGRTADAATQQGLGELQLKTAESLDARRGTLRPEEQRRLDECLAQALVATNQPIKAAAAYEALLARSPKDAALRRTVAEALMRADTKETWKKSKALWRQLEAAGKAGSADWLLARLQTARCALALGELEECRKLLVGTRLLYPDLGGADLAKKFAEVERTLQEATKKPSAGSR